LLCKVQIHYTQLYFLFSYQNNLSGNFIEDKLIHRTDIRREVNKHRLVKLSEDYRCRISTDIVS